MIPAMLLLAASLAADAPKLSDEAKKELAKFDGQWKFVEWIRAGESQAPGADDDILFEIKDGHVKVLVDGKIIQESRVAALDPKKNPKTLDMKARLADAKRDETTEEGIYMFEKERLFICVYKGKDKRRPMDFDTVKQEEVELFVLERKKK